jgi:hypothetical protein
MCTLQVAGRLATFGAPCTAESRAVTGTRSTKLPHDQHHAQKLANSLLIAQVVGVVGPLTWRLMAGSAVCELAMTNARLSAGAITFTLNWCLESSGMAAGPAEMSVCQGRTQVLSWKMMF